MFRFIDLFCGIGGFHQAMTSFGGRCVFSAEIDPDCIEVYYNNYGLDAGHDMTKIDERRIPQHEVLCAGFPCQAFSKAGKQAGINDTRGTLFFEIERVLRCHHTPYIILENVRNLVSHDNGRTWKIITDVLHDIGYRLTAAPLILSPHQFGVPQLRERVYIVGVYDPDNVEKPLDLSFDNLLDKKDLSIYDILEIGKVSKEYAISDVEERVLQAWDEFYKGIDIKVIGFPVNVEYFHTSYEMEDIPEWKQSHITRNKQLYARNKEFIDQWLKKWDVEKTFTPTQKKFEWQCGDGVDSIFDALIQMRPSGVRVKMPNVFPALVAMVQIPIIGKYHRRLTVRECARLQSFPDSFRPSNNKHQALKQFGNSVNINVLEAIFAQLDNKYGPIVQDDDRELELDDHQYQVVPEGVQLSLFEPGSLYISKNDSTLLIGTCRQGNKEWILTNKLYNYPVTENDMLAHPELMRVKKLIVMYRRKPIGYYQVNGVKVVSKKELEDLNYPTSSSRHKKDDQYLLFNLTDEKNEMPPLQTSNFNIVLGKGVSATGNRTLLHA